MSEPLSRGKLVELLDYAKTFAAEGRWFGTNPAEIVSVVSELLQAREEIDSLQAAVRAADVWIEKTVGPTRKQDRNFSLEFRAYAEARAKVVIPDVE